MAGGSKRRHSRNPTAGGPRHGAGAGRRRPVPELPSFISPSSAAEVFSSGRGRGRGRRVTPPASNAVPFTYPCLRLCSASSETAQALEVTIDTTPCADPSASVPVYSYDPDLVGGLGLGFHAEDEEGEAEVAGESGLHLGLGFQDPGEEMDVEVEQLDEATFMTPKPSNGGRNAGFLSIGGVRIYTEDISSPESEGIGSSDEESDSEDDDEEVGNSFSGEDSSGSEDLSIGNSGSSVDDEVVADYMEGIGGSEELLNGQWVAGMKLADSDDDDGMDMDEDEDGLVKKGKGKLEGYALMNASEQYGMMRPKSSERRKGKGSGGVCERDLMTMQVQGLEDLMMVKDARMVYGARQGAKAGSSSSQLSQLSRSWPNEGRKSQRYRGVPGEKKKHRKELIAKKRHQRMLSRGVDLEQINTKLRQMVVDRVNMLCFQPMHSRDCSQVQRLASIYNLKSGCQGSGKKRFVTVTLTGESSLPSSAGKVRLDKLLGTELEDFAVNWDNAKGPGRGKDFPAQAKLTRHRESSGKGSTKKQISFAERPVSFVSSGTMVESVTETIAVGSSSGDALCEKLVESNSVKLGTFEMHTTGFGSKMMAKMGFVEGTGLGKDGQGMVQPIQPIQRPKSLGLGVEFDGDASNTKAEMCGVRSELSTDTRSEPRSNSKSEMKGIGSFERHTKGFGSKMMAKMGFVPGTGLGKDGQGIVTPLTTVRRPKVRGLGAKDY